MKITVILLMGPTATGKTELALRLAEIYPIEIISVDSALVYKDMDIGTAKPSSIELSKVPHHLIDIISPLESYSVASFSMDCVRLINEINVRGRIPLLVGGTMMYYNALINGLSTLPESDRATRADLEARGLEFGFEQLHQELARVDMVAAQRIMPTDKQRIIRALEVYMLTGIPITELQQTHKLDLAKNINFVPLAIIPKQREILHSRINTRFERMLEQGLITEVERLRSKYPALNCDHSSMRSVGYNQVWQYLDKRINYTELLDMGCAATRQLAKRQITWLNNMKMPTGEKLINLDQDSSLSIAKLFLQLRAYCNEIFRS